MIAWITVALTAGLAWGAWILWRESDGRGRNAVLCAVAIMMVVRQLDRLGF